MALETSYAKAIQHTADSVLAQIEAGTAPSREHCFGSTPTVRVYFADIPYMGEWHNWVPRGVVRVAVDLDPIRDSWPVHEVRVCFDPHDFDAGEAGPDIAAAVLEHLAETAAIVR